MLLWSISAPVEAVAFATAVHGAFIVLLRHRVAPLPGRFLFLFPAVAFGCSPWLFPTAGGIAVGLGAQVAWFIAVERLAVRTPPAKTVAAPAAGGTVPAVPGSSRRARQFAPVTVLAVHQETDTIRTFRLTRPRDFSFTAGQFLTVRVDIDGHPHARCYSISSAPDCRGYLEISVRRLGLVSTALHTSVRPGSVLFVEPPAGRFVYPANDDRPLALMAGGVGITPVLSMLRHAVATEPTRPVTLLYSCRSADDVAFADELELLAARHPQLRLAIVTSGHIDAALVRRTVDSPAGSLFYICGPGPMMDAMRVLLLAEGVPDAQIRNEVFQPATAIGARAAAPAAATRTARAACTVSNRVIDVPAGVTLLEAAEAGGVAIASLCRSGVCGTCRTKLLSGNVRCTSDALDEEDRANGYILPCVAWPEGDCALEA